MRKPRKKLQLSSLATTHRRHEPLILNLRITYEGAKVSTIEAATFRDPYEAMKEICLLEFVEECIILQTCNRVEIYTVVTDKGEAERGIIDYWLKKTRVDGDKLHKSIEVSTNSEAYRHLLSLASGLKSMIIGEDQILGQIRDAYIKSRDIETTGSILGTAFMKAVSVGRRARKETSINKGAVSISSSAVDLIEGVLGGLNGIRVLVIGAGEAGTLVGKALAERKTVSTFVANRTYKRAVRLSQMTGGKAIRFDKLDEMLPTVDVIIVATGAPHYILTKKRVEKALLKRKKKGKMIIVDISQPRNVENKVRLLPNVELHDIDALRATAEENLKKRLKEAEKAKEIVLEEVKHLELLIKRKQAEPVISDLCARMEKIRQKELKKALKMLKSVNERQRTIINDLTKVLIRRTLQPAFNNLRVAAEKGDLELISAVEKLFNIEISEKR